MSSTQAGPSNTQASLSNPRRTRQQYWVVFNAKKAELMQANLTPSQRHGILNNLWAFLSSEIDKGWRATQGLENELTAWKGQVQELEGRVEELEARESELEAQLQDAEYVSTLIQFTGI